MLRDLLGEHLLKGEGHSGQLPPLSDLFWLVLRDGYCGRQARERNPVIRKDSRKEQAVVPTGFLPF